jgi:general secretion pathway protein A
MLTVSSPTSQSPHKAHAIQAHLQALELTRPPFPVTPDDEQAFFFSEYLNEKYEELKHFILLRKGFMLVTGEVGVGKTTLTHLLLGHLEKGHVKTALIINTFLQDIELIRAINRDFNLSPQVDTLEGNLQCLNAFLMDAYMADFNCVLIIDDAQRLDINSLELIRQLSNLETAHDKLIQIILVAQPEIMETLNRFDLRQLRSRIALHIELPPLALEEIDHYLHHRLSLAGSNSTIKVSSRAIQDLFRATGGYPRLIHLVMDRCLFGLVANNTRMIDAHLMRQAIKESSLYQSPAQTRKRQAKAVRPGLVLTFAGVLITGLAFAATYLGAKNDPSPAVRESAPIKNEPDKTPSAHIESPEWRSFLDAYPGIKGVTIKELRKNSAAELDALRKELAPYRWIPVMISSNGLDSCQGFPTLPLHTDTGEQKRLALFRTDLPMSPIPFSESGDDVKLLQSTLASLGYMPASEMDGVMGGRTANALARFQKIHGLASTGQPDVRSGYEMECALPQKQAWNQ